MAVGIAVVTEISVFGPDCALELCKVLTKITSVNSFHLSETGTIIFTPI